MARIKADLSELAGKEIVDIVGMEKDSEEVTITTQCGTKFYFFHEKDCCEAVRLIDFECDAELGATIISAELVHSEAAEEDLDKYNQVGIWSFYKIETTTGGIWMRWLGESEHRFYSIEVEFQKDA